MFDWGHYIVVFAIALAVTTLLVPVVRRLAIRYDIVDRPGPRRVNKDPIPRLGGIAMYCGILAALAVEIIFEYFSIWEGPFVFWTPDKTAISEYAVEFVAVINPQFIGFLVGLTFIVVLGIFDDIYSLRPLIKFCGQLIACCIIAGTGTLIARFNLPFSNVIVSLGTWAYPITVIYLVCFINIINLIDGLDGLAAGVTGIASILLFIMTITLLREDAALTAVILTAVCIAFLFYNFNPASVFMGDCGSMMLGLMLGTVSLLGAARFASVTIMIVPIVIALVPIIDTFGAIVRRVRSHESIATADVGHIHHRLMRAGLTQRKAVLFIYGWTALLSVGALLIWEVGGFVKYCVFIALLIVSAFIVLKLGLFVPVRTHVDGDTQSCHKDKKEASPEKSTHEDSSC